jgi:predicted transcriptional regulator of viral defense system/very-short-patch-repair endonuclease
MPSDPSAEWHILPAERELCATRAVSAIARRQHGTIAHGQLRGAGLSTSTIGRWVADGRLIRLYGGVYAVGHASLTSDGHRMAQALAAGPGSCLVDRSAGSLHGLLVDHRTVVDIATPRGGARNRASFVAHRRTLRPDEITTVRGIPVTTIERTLLDIAATGRPGDLAKALERAEELQVLDLQRLRRQIRRSRGQRGVARLRAAVDALQPTDPRLIRSKLETGVLQLIERHKLPEPKVNLWLFEWEVDLHWPELKVAIELDGWGSHKTKAARDRDYDRDLGLSLRGYETHRISWDQFRDQRAAVVAALRLWLKPRGDPRTPAPA